MFHIFSNIHTLLSFSLKNTETIMANIFTDLQKKRYFLKSVEYDVQARTTQYLNKKDFLTNTHFSYNVTVPSCDLKNVEGHTVIPIHFN